MSESKVIVSLDLTDLDRIKKLVTRLKGVIEIFKIGAIPFTYFGPELIRWLKENDCRVMLDLKYHDIPNTVARACEGAMELGVDMITIHASGGFPMLEEAVKATLLVADVKKIERPRLLGVTILTSIDEAYFKDLFGDISRSLEEQVVFLAQLARSAGLDGVVASPDEIKAIRRSCGAELIIVTPGIRIQDEPVDADDQARVMTPRAAIEAGANYIVIGRPIVKAEDPASATRKIMKEIAGGN